MPQHPPAPNHISLPPPPPPIAPANPPSASQQSSSAANTSSESRLTALGLQQYIPACTKAGLTIESLSQLSEPEFERLGISIGHRRKLQRAFARGHGWEDARPLPSPLPSPEEWKEFRNGGGGFGFGVGFYDESTTGESPMAGSNGPPGRMGKESAEDGSREASGNGQRNGDGEETRRELGVRMEGERTYTPEGKGGGSLDAGMRVSDLLCGNEDVEERKNGSG